MQRIRKNTRKYEKILPNSERIRANLKDPKEAERIRRIPTRSKRIRKASERIGESMGEFN